MDGESSDHNPAETSSSFHGFQAISRDSMQPRVQFAAYMQSLGVTPQAPIGDDAAFASDNSLNLSAHALAGQPQSHQWTFEGECVIRHVGCDLRPKGCQETFLARADKPQC